MYGISSLKNANAQYLESSFKRFSELDGRGYKLIDRI